MKKALLILPLLVCFSVFANNINIENVELKSQNIGNKTVKIEFDLSWDNSWRTTSGPANYDAAWVFAKYRVNSGEWKHVFLNYVNGTSDGHTAPSGATIKTASDKRGCMIYRSINGSGDNNWDDIGLQWNYGENSVGDNDQVDIQIFAIEMVQVPQGNFYLGGGNGSEVGKFYSFLTNVSYLVSSENQITVGSGAGNLNYSNVSSGYGDGLGPIPAAFPKGFNEFFCMKYEMTQGQWVSFFNTLTPTQKIELDITGIDGKNSDATGVGNTISWLDGSTSATTSTPDLPLNYVSTKGSLAYLDWAALRPMTELEYEKACRGPLNKVADDFAWGNSNISSGFAFTVANQGLNSEYITNPSTLTGNANYIGTVGGNYIYRVGIFAASAINKTREETGATYYGIMEMSGNLFERAVTVGKSIGRTFTGLHGNGQLAITGLADVANWPNSTTGEGIGYRGGCYANSFSVIRVSDRIEAASIISPGNSRLSFRGVRSAL